MQYVNESEKFWKHSYRVYLVQQACDGIIVNADHEQDALDFAIDYAEKQGWEGYFLDNDEIDERIDKDTGEVMDAVCGGNNCRYLNSYEIRIEKLD